MQLKDMTRLEKEIMFYGVILHQISSSRHCKPCPWPPVETATAALQGDAQEQENLSFPRLHFTARK